MADSPVAWSRRRLYLHDNKIESLAGVSWPSSLTFVSPLTCSERQSIPALPHPVCRYVATRILTDARAPAMIMYEAV
jgi:hypothetical protein